MANRSVKQPIFLSLILAAAPMVASAITPIVVKVVPWVATSPATPHYAWAAKQITLKGTTNVAGGTYTYDWDPGDGTAHCTGVVADMNAVGCDHTYTVANGATVGNVFNAILTVWDSNTGTGPPGATATNIASASYYTQIYNPPPNLQVEVNAAIDAGLWNLHTTMARTTAISGNGPGTGASFSVTTNTAGPPGEITGISLNSGGSGYVSPTLVVNDGYCALYKVVSIPQPCGSGFTASTTVVGGVITSVTITNAGQNYSLQYPSLGTYGYASNTVTVYDGVITATTFGTWSGNSPGGVTATDCTAFEVSGHKESGPASDPYTDTVAACLGGVFDILGTTTVTGTKTNTHGTFALDSNGNGIGVHLNQGNDQYQSGMMLDAISAAGTPNHAVTFGPLASLTHPGGSGAYTYMDTVTDMVDYNVYCQSASGTVANQGAWDYSCLAAEDNSTTQWVVIGLLSATRDLGISVPAETRAANSDWVAASQTAGFGGNGYFGYRAGEGPIWGPFAVTPSGMVQMAFDGIGRNAPLTCCNPAGATQWDWAETFMRDDFDIPQQNSAYNDVKDYYYGMFSLTKSMLLHDNSGTGMGSSPIQFMRSLDNAAKPDIDWYAAQDATFGGSDTSNGVARTLVSGTPSAGVTGQNANGSWSGHDYTGETSQFNTAWAIIMLNHTVTQLVPVACITPNGPTGPNNTSVHVNGNCSFQQDPTKQIVSWDWDVSGNAGTNFTKHGVNLNNVFVNPGGTYPYNYPVRLRITDNSTPIALTADLVFNVVITLAAGSVPPVANSGGPYNFCMNTTPWHLDGSLSSQSPPDTITGYKWDFSCGNALTDSILVQPRVDIGTNNYFTRGPGNYCAKLQVTNNDNLSNVATSNVNVYAATDLHCSNCVQQPTGRAKNASPGSPGNAQLYWADSNSALFPVDHYNVYRSSTSSFDAFTEIAGANGVYPAIPVPTGALLYQGSQMHFVDGTAATAATYFYRISPALANDTNTCASPVTVQVVVKATR